MNDNSYSGREYASKMLVENIKFDIAVIGNYPVHDEIEERRCGGLWNPPCQNLLFKKLSFFEFNDLKSDLFLKFIIDNKYDIGIQGGTGIIKKNIINKFNYGILNFHPGDLPNYRGCSAPEWQIFENNDVISTCHFIDEGIDSGSILEKKKLNVSKKNYNYFRASIYPETAIFVVELLQKIFKDINFLKTKKPQKINTGKYRKYIGDKKIRKLKFIKND